MCQPFLTCRRGNPIVPDRPPRRCRIKGMPLPTAFLLLSVVAAMLPTAAGGEEAGGGREGTPPNIVLIVADDYGWTDTSTGRPNLGHGSKYYRTPNIDRLACEGTSFTSAYTCGPNCAPTRACLMSGLYTPRHGVYTVSSGARGREKDRKLIPVKNRTTLDPSYVTLAEALKAVGYTNVHLGKWHLGSPGQAGPLEQGFDFNFGGNHSGSPRGGYFSPYKNPQLADGPKGENLTDRLAEEAAGQIRRHRDRPFFIYLPFYAVHTPIQAKQELKTEYAKRPAHGGHNNPAYAAMVETMDAGVGRVLDVLDELKLTKNTLVIFTSDNGGLGGYKSIGLTKNKNITDNAPLRGGKGCLYEGGVRVPMVVRYPGVAQPEGICHEPVITVDFYPTLAAVAKAKTPEQLDGENLLPLLRDPSAKLDRDALYWHFPGYLQAYGPGNWRTTPAGAIRAGKWKLIEFFEDERVELYNLDADLGEQNDLAQAEPDTRDRLHKMLRAWRDEVEAPMPRRK